METEDEIGLLIPKCETPETTYARICTMDAKPRDS